MAGGEYEALEALRPALEAIEAEVLTELVRELTELTDFATEHQHGSAMSEADLETFDEGVKEAYERYGALGLQVAMVRCCIVMARHWIRHRVQAGGVEDYLRRDPDLADPERLELAVDLTGSLVLAANGLSDHLSDRYAAIRRACPNRGVRLRLLMSVWLAFVSYGSEVGLGVNWCAPASAPPPGPAARPPGGGPRGGTSGTRP